MELPRVCAIIPLLHSCSFVRSQSLVHCHNYTPTLGGELGLQEVFHKSLSCVPLNREVEESLEFTICIPLKGQYALLMLILPSKDEIILRYPNA